MYGIFGKNPVLQSYRAPVWPLDRP